jgi:hypothetical protein
VSPTGWLLDGASVVDPAGGAPVSPLAGRRPDDGGPFALLLKPHTIDAVQMQLLVADRPLLVELLATIDDDADIATIGAQLGAAAAHVGRRVVYSPLVEATSAVPVPMSTPVPSSTSTHGTAPYLAAAHRFEARF